MSYFDWQVVQKIALVGLIHTIKMLLTAWSLRYNNIPPSRNDSTNAYPFSPGQIPLYLLARVILMPIYLILTIFIEQTMPTRRTIYCALLANLSFFVAISFSVFDIIWETLIAGIISTVFVVLFQVLLLQKYKELDQHLGCHEIIPMDLVVVDSETDQRPIDGSKTAAFWYILQYTSGLSIFLLLITLFFSSEPGHIYRNCYILDVRTFWVLMLGSCCSYYSVFTSTLLLLERTSSLTVTFLSLPTGVLQLILLSHSKLSHGCLVGGLMTIWFSWRFLLSRRQEDAKSTSKNGRNLWTLVRSTIVALILVIGFVYAVQQPSATARIVRVASLTSVPTKDPHVGWINRPINSVIVRDDYLGARPHVDMVADLPLLARKCRDFYSANEKNHDGLKCLTYLATAEAEYYLLPEEGHMLRASEQDPRKAEYANADGNGNSRTSYQAPSSAIPASKENIGTCAGPIVPYHIYWIGQTSWRVELYVKSYLYTQNLPCSRLWLWLDVDRNPHALRDFPKDPAFGLFSPLIARGDIVLKGWKFPTEIPIPIEPGRSDRIGFYARPIQTKRDGFLKVADEVVQDPDGQLWLQYNKRFRPFLNDYMSDTARFTILHLHGGLWCDIDILLLRDLRPLVLPHPVHGRLSFGEQWVERSHITDYNSAVLSTSANSSFSTFLLHGGVRMGMNFCPKVLGRMTWKENRTAEFPMLDTAAFDPSTTTINRVQGRKCSVPCHENYSDIFVGRPGLVYGEWRDYQDEPLQEINTSELMTHSINNSGGGVPTETTQRLQYDPSHDPYPPNNRTLQNFFRGAWGYHIHNQVIPFISSVILQNPILILDSGRVILNLHLG